MLRALLCALLARLGGGVIGTPSVQPEALSWWGGRAPADATRVGGVSARVKNRGHNREEMSSRDRPDIPASSM